MIQLPDYKRLVDPRLGVIKRLVRYANPPEFPSAYVAYGADVADTAWLAAWHGDRVALGAAFYDHERAQQAAIGEAVERYCSNYVPTGLRRATYHELLAAGEPALNPADLALYAASQYQARGFPFVPFTADLPVHWVEGHDMVTGERILVPASITYTNYYAGPRANEPATNFVMFAGCAAGPTRALAEQSALEEVIERDATMIWWMSGSPAPGIDWSNAPVIRASVTSADGSADIQYHLIQIRTLFDVPVIGALLDDRQLGIVALGIACRADPVAAALKALLEAIHLRVFSKELLDPHGQIWQAMRLGILSPRFYKPYRADRSYLDDFRPDFHDIIDLGAQSQIYLDPRMRRHTERITHLDTYVSFAELPAIVSDDLRMAYLKRIAAHGFRAISVDITTADVRATGLCVVRVIVPGLYCNAPAAFPFLGGRRLYEEPATQGWIATPLTEDQLVRVPLPHC